MIEKNENIEDFKQAYKELNGDVSRLARKFGVSRGAAETRAKSLSLM